MTAQSINVNVLNPNTPVSEGQYVIYVAAPNAIWEAFLKFVARLGGQWDGVTKKVAAEYNARATNGLKLVFPNAGSYFKVVQNGKTVSFPRKGFDQSRKSLYFIVQFKRG